jgi:hypothetical protein
MPQKAWSNKRERQYEHVKESEQKQGRSTKRAKEIAARTVNKQRAQSGETKGSSGSSSRSSSSSSRSSSTRSSSRSTPSRSTTSRSKSSSASRNGQEMTKEQLYNEAKRLGIEGRSKMNKAALKRAVSRKKK